jgi:hypothetical protein
MEAITTSAAHTESVRFAALPTGIQASRGRRSAAASGTGLGEGFLDWSQDRWLSIGRRN